MKKLLLTLSLCGLSLIMNAQNVSVEKSTYGIQVGLLGIWGHQEIKFANEIALRTELGFDCGIWGGSLYDKTGYVFNPVITLEPRWYYNLIKRKNKSKRIDGNSGSFVSIKTSYHPDGYERDGWL